tara:strand:- start:2706 stop:3605 length:900 start_codon:yes stop_codon:yes gene_type:complete
MDVPEKIEIGIIGGSGLYNIEELKDVNEIDIDTPFGKTSDSLRIGKISGTKVIFLARHGRNHSFLPSEVPYKANIWAMKYLGVKWLISASAVGSLKSEIKPLDVVIPDQFIDRTHNRPISFFGNGLVAHASLAHPFCDNLSKLIYEVAVDLAPKKISIHKGGTYLCMEGPAFSTKAESEFYRSINCSIIGMTNHTEARLAREAEIAYSTIAMSTDYDCWHEGHDNVTVEMIVNNLRANASFATEIICSSIKKVGSIRPSSFAHSALKDALLTNKKNVPYETREKVDIITRKYWGKFSKK